MIIATIKERIIKSYNIYYLIVFGTLWYDVIYKYVDRNMV